ncbi:MAG TPA: hotdog fold domain-containing protein [Phenylobacterium sp.]|nr:hotdog fold domain-containing protein [Phenylobacterium sp.]
MSDPSEILRRQASAPDGPAAAALLLQPLLTEAVGAGARPVSLTLDYGAPLQAGEPVSVEAWVDRATRTLVFAHARATLGSGALAASGSAVFRRDAPPAQGSKA